LINEMYGVEYCFERKLTVRPNMIDKGTYASGFLTRKLKGLHNLFTMSLIFPILIKIEGFDRYIGIFHSCHDNKIDLKWIIFYTYTYKKLTKKTCHACHVCHAYPVPFEIYV
jgi:hypothetical protein